MRIDSQDPTPIYAQLERAIRADIAMGRLQVGDRLPTIRQLAGELRINANTVAKVYSELERSGVLSTQRGVGTFVREPAESQAAKYTSRDREHFLHHSSDRLLADAHAMGLSIDDVIQYLESRRSQMNR
jgi:GntR family transcriptional regulator